jgi:hypothetical protein
VNAGTRDAGHDETSATLAVPVVVADDSTNAAANSPPACDSIEAAPSEKAIRRSVFVERFDLPPMPRTMQRSWQQRVMIWASQPKPKKREWASDGLGLRQREEKKGLFKQWKATIVSNVMEGTRWMMIPH